MIPSVIARLVESGDCLPKCAVLGRENIESPEPELFAMADDDSVTADNLFPGLYCYTIDGW